MSYLFQLYLSLELNTKRVARDLVDEGIGHIDKRDLTDGETVHDLRKRCKKLRALLRLVRSDMEEVYAFENSTYRDTSRELAEVRDSDVMIEALESLYMDSEGQVQSGIPHSIRSILQDRRDAIYAEDGWVRSRLDIVRCRFVVSKARIESWTIERNDFSLLREGFEKTYSRGKKEMDTAFAVPTEENFHDWRKRVKDHWYHVRLLESSWPHMMVARAEEIYRLSQFLGDDHDLGILRQWISSEECKDDDYGATRSLLKLIDDRKSQLRALAEPLGARIYSEKPAQLGRRMKACWDVGPDSRQVTPEMSGH